MEKQTLISIDSKCNELGYRVVMTENRKGYENESIVLASSPTKNEYVVWNFANGGLFNGDYYGSFDASQNEVNLKLAIQSYNKRLK